MTVFKINPEVKAALERERFKEQRTLLLSTLTVTVDGMTFDANEESQNRLARAVAGMEEGETSNWVLADNTAVEVDRVTLKAVLKAAVEAQTQLWT